MTYNERLHRARTHNAALDAIDRRNANPTPAEAGGLALFETAMEAIRAGLKGEDLDMVAEGYVMLRDFDQMILRRLS